MKFVLVVLGALYVSYCTVRAADKSDNCCKKVCVLDDATCATKGAFAVYKAVVAGIKALGIKPLDPLVIATLKGTQSNCTDKGTTYVLTNIELKGLKNTVVSNLILNVTDESYKHYVNAPKLIATFNYVGPNATTCQDKIVITVQDYEILNTGYYGVFVKKEDHLPHFFIKTLATKTHLKSQTNLEIKRDGNKVLPSELSKDTAEFLISLIVKEAMRLVFVGLETHMRFYVMGDVLPAGNVKTCKQKQ